MNFHQDLSTPYTIGTNFLLAAERAKILKSEETAVWDKELFAVQIYGKAVKKISKAIELLKSHSIR